MAGSSVEGSSVAGAAGAGSSAAGASSSAAGAGSSLPLGAGAREAARRETGDVRRTMENTNLG